MPDENYSLDEIRKDLDRRMKTIADLKERLQNLWEEIGELIGEIDEIEGKGSGRRRRGRKRAVALADAIGGAAPEPAGEEHAPEAAQPAPYGLPEKLFPDELTQPPAHKPKRRPAPVKREGPSIVDVAEAILRETGKTFLPSELARMVEEKGVSSGNTQQVLLLAAGRKTRLVKNAEGHIALPDAHASGSEAPPAPPQEA